MSNYIKIYDRKYGPKNAIDVMRRIRAYNSDKDIILTDGKLKLNEHYINDIRFRDKKIALRTLGNISKNNGLLYIGSDEEHILKDKLPNNQKDIIYIDDNEYKYNYNQIKILDSENDWYKEQIKDLIMHKIYGYKKISRCKFDEDKYIRMFSNISQLIKILYDYYTLVNEKHTVDDILEFIFGYDKKENIIDNLELLKSNMNNNDKINNREFKLDVLENIINNENNILKYITDIRKPFYINSNNKNTNNDNINYYTLDFENIIKDNKILMLNSNDRNMNKYIINMISYYTDKLNNKYYTYIDDSKNMKYYDSGKLYKMFTMYNDNVNYNIDNHLFEVNNNSRNFKMDYIEDLSYYDKW